MGEADIPSPCILVCTLDATRTCLGCGRTITEIAGWRTMDAAERRMALKSARQRLAGIS